MRLLSICGGAILALTACGGGEDATPAPSPTPFSETISGAISIPANGAATGFRDDGEPCVGDRGYDDMREGGAVTVRDGDGAIIATGRLDAGRFREIGGVIRCYHGFAIEDVPLANFYSIEVTHRGEISYSFTEMEDAGWTVALTLGD